MFIRLITSNNLRRIRWPSLSENREFIIRKLKDFLSCSTPIATKIYDDYPVIRCNEQLDLVKKNVEFLIEKNISIESIADNAYILMLKYGKCCDSIA